MRDLKDFQRKARPVIATAAPFVIALVRVGRIELLDKIGIGTVNLHAIKTRFNGAVHRITKFFDHDIDFIRGQRPGRGGPFARRGDGAGCDRRFPANQRRLNHTTTVVNLQDSF